MYIGRFAPSPTGPLHFGSLIAAAGSYIDARANGGRWLVRIDDLDPPREQPGAAEGILRTLEAFGFEWDGPVIYQSRRHTVYENALARLCSADLIYPCTCTRRTLRNTGRTGPHGRVYPGTCRGRSVHRVSGPHSLRIRTADQPITVDDAVQGAYRTNPARDIGDFNVKRRDGYYAYHLATAVDDAEQGITHVVRGGDLLDSTPAQVYIQQQLNLATACYAHLPVATNGRGQKLSKQTGAAALNPDGAGCLIWSALAFLGHRPPTDLKNASPVTLWHWAIEHWSLNNIPRRSHSV